MFSGWLLSEAPVDPVYLFIGEFQNHEGSMLTARDPIRRYIDERRDTELAEWDILFTSLRRPAPLLDESLGIPINCQSRTPGDKSTTTTLHVSSRQRVSSRGVEKTGLTDQEIERAEVAFRRQRESEDGSTVNYPDWAYRRERTRPLLIIHLLRIDDKSEREPVENPEPVVAWSISFPKTETPEQRVEYVVNTTWLRENYGDDLEEEELRGDDA